MSQIPMMRKITKFSYDHQASCHCKDSPIDKRRAELFLQGKLGLVSTYGAISSASSVLIAMLVPRNWQHRTSRRHRCRPRRRMV